MTTSGEQGGAQEGEEDYLTLLARMRDAWVSAGGPEAEAAQANASPPKTYTPPPKKEPPPKPLDIATALDWYDAILRYRAENPAPATAREIEHAWEQAKGRYAPTQFPLPVADMTPLKLSIGAWRDVFAEADRWLTKKGAANDTPPPYQLFFKIAGHHTDYRKKLQRKEDRLTQIRQARRQAPSE